MTSLIKVSAFALIFVTLAGCRSTSPIEDVNHQIMPEQAKAMSEAQIGEKIIRTLSTRGFYCNKTAANKLTCSMDARKHQATIAIIYSPYEFSIHHISSTNLKEKNGKIHPKYNKWVNTIKKDILKAIAAGK